MCDTQVLVTGDGVWLAKNSDREPSEEQVVERIPAVSGDSTDSLQCTHIRIPQVPDRHALLLSRPAWIWGAEMGINDQGVAIGNEAIFSRQRSLTPGLLGMDLLRLGLERSDTALAALHTMTALLERHGQGGPAGFRDSGFHYDNSFLIADSREAWLLETAGRAWAARRITSHHAISNALTLDNDFDLHGGGTRPDRSFRRLHDTRLLPAFAGAAARRQLGMQCLAETAAAPHFQQFFRHLRQHAHGGERPVDGSNADVCLHANGIIRRSQSTGAMVAHLSTQGSRACFTGSSAPCLSLFRPITFEAPADHSSSLLGDVGTGQSLWRRHEAVHRRALFDPALRTSLRADIAETEAAMHDLLDADHWSQRAVEAADQLARQSDQRGVERLAAARAGGPLKLPLSPAGLYWRHLNRRDGIQP